MRSRCNLAGNKTTAQTLRPPQDADKPVHPPQIPTRSPDVEVATKLLQCSRKANLSRAFQAVADTLRCGTKKAKRMAEAVAETSLRAQAKTLQETLSYGKAMQQAGTLQVLLFLWRTSYDETPLRCCVAFKDDEASHLHTEIAKVYVQENSWSLLLKTLRPPQASQGQCGASEYLHLQGHLSPMLQCADGMTGEAVAGILRSTQSRFLPADFDAAKDALLSVRLSETDEAGSNLRGERLLCGASPSWSLLHFMCCCHKLHACAERTWALQPQVLQGVVRMLLALQQSSQWSRVRSVALELVDRMGRRQRKHLSDKALRYRQSVMQTWFLPPNFPRKRAALLVASALLFNGDWLDESILAHNCPGEHCCPDQGATLKKMKAMLLRLLKFLRPNVLCRCNWANWSIPMSFVGLLWHMHGLLGHLMLKALVPVLSSVLGNVSFGMLCNSTHTNPESPHPPNLGGEDFTPQIWGVCLKKYCKTSVF